MQLWSPRANLRNKMNMIVLKLFAVDRQKKKKEKSKGITLRLT